MKWMGYCMLNSVQATEDGHQCMPLPVQVAAGELNSAQHVKLSALLKSYGDVFSSHDNDYGYTTTVTHDITYKLVTPTRSKVQATCTGHSGAKRVAAPGHRQWSLCEKKTGVCAFAVTTES